MKKDILLSNKTLRIAGIAGIIGGLLLLISDLSSGITGATFPAGLGEINELRLALATYLAIYGLPLYILGFWVMYQGLKPAGEKWALPTFLIHSYWVVHIAIHTTFPFYAVVQRMEDSLPIEEVLERFGAYTAPIMGVFFIIGILSFILYFLTIFFHKTHFPRWLAFVHGGFVMIILLILRVFAPSAAHFLVVHLSLPALTILLMMTLFTIFMWNKPHKEKL